MLGYRQCRGCGRKRPKKEEEMKRVGQGAQSRGGSSRRSYSSPEAAKEADDERKRRKRMKTTAAQRAAISHHTRCYEAMRDNETIRAYILHCFDEKASSGHSRRFNFDWSGKHWRRAPNKHFSCHLREKFVHNIGVHDPRAIQAGVNRILRDAGHRARKAPKSTSARKATTRQKILEEAKAVGAKKVHITDEGAVTYEF
jgi:hypothetical protein